MKWTNIIRLLGVPTFVRNVAATSRFRVAIAPFPLLNATSVKGTSPNSTNTNGTVACFPFEDPHCCIDRIVCECKNGTFFSANYGHNDTDFCTPPGDEEYGEDISSVPEWCC